MPELDALIPGYTSYDATILDLHIETPTGNIFFKYTFASEEYNEYVNSQYNDVFGFFLDGVNIALIPGTTTPVAINNVNCGDPYAPPGGSNCSSFNNNDPSDGGPFYNIQYDGFTDVFTASFYGLTPGEHHLHLAIADAGDHILDSAVFIQAGSLTPTIPEPASIALMGLGLAALGAARVRSKNKL